MILRQRKPTSRLAALRLCWRLSLLLWVIAGPAILLVRWSEVRGIWNAPKLSSPVVGLESDDWGTDYDAARFVAADSELDARQAEAVPRMVSLLRSHRDSIGRPPIISAFVVVGHPDVKAILDDDRDRYHWLPLDQAMPRAVAALKAAVSAGVFEVDYHGRDHRDGNLWAARLREAARTYLAQGKPFDPNVASTFETDDPRQVDELVAEYFDSRTMHLGELNCGQIEQKLAEGLAEFERIFRKRATGTVAPRYLWGPTAETSWLAHDLRVVHGINRQRGPAAVTGSLQQRLFGFRTETGLFGVPRNVDIEPRTVRSATSVRDTMDAIRKAVRTGQPAVISTHAWGYYHPDKAVREAMFRDLDAVMSAIEREYPELRYFSAEELGQIAQTGQRKGSGATETQGNLVATGLRHAWLSGRCVYSAIPVLTAWLWGGLGLLLLGVVLALTPRVWQRMVTRTG